MRTQQRQPPFGPHSPHSRISQSLTTTREGPPHALPRGQRARSLRRLQSASQEHVGQGAGFFGSVTVPWEGPPRQSRALGTLGSVPQTFCPPLSSNIQARKASWADPGSHEGGSNSKWSWWLSPEGASGETARAGHSPPGSCGASCRAGASAPTAEGTGEGWGGPLGLCPEAKQLKPPDLRRAPRWLIHDSVPPAAASFPDTRT